MRETTFSPPAQNPLNFSELEELLLEEAAAEFLKLSPRTMQAFRIRGGGPPFVRISSRAVRYRLRDLIEWIESRTVSSTSDTGQAA